MKKRNNGKTYQIRGATGYCAYFALISLILNIYALYWQDNEAHKHYICFEHQQLEHVDNEDANSASTPSPTTTNLDKHKYKKYQKSQPQDENYAFVIPLQTKESQHKHEECKYAPHTQEKLQLHHHLHSVIASSAQAPLIPNLSSNVNVYSIAPIISAPKTSPPAVFQLT